MPSYAPRRDSPHISAMSRSSPKIQRLMTRKSQRTLRSQMQIAMTAESLAERPVLYLTHQSPQWISSLSLTRIRATCLTTPVQPLQRLIVSQIHCLLTDMLMVNLEMIECPPQVQITRRKSHQCEKR